MNMSEEPPEQFWKVYDSVVDKERHNLSNYMTADKDTVGKEDLVAALYDSGEFSRMEAKRYIFLAIKSNKLKVVSWDTYRKEIR